MVIVKINGQGQPIEYPVLKTVLQLQAKLGLRVNDALIIREGELLTPDRRLRPGDAVEVRMVTSRG